jgi:transposase
VGIDTAGPLLVAVGDNPERLASEASFAALCGVSPVDASYQDGSTDTASIVLAIATPNRALWVIAIVRMASDPITQAYVQRRTQQGLSKKEVLHCLKHYIARQLYRLPTRLSQLTLVHPLPLTSNRSVGAGREVRGQGGASRVQPSRVRPARPAGV